MQERVLHEKRESRILRRLFLEQDPWNLLNSKSGKGWSELSEFQLKKNVSSSGCSLRILEAC